MTKRKIWIILFIIGIVMILGASEFSRFLANEINWYTAGIILSIVSGLGLLFEMYLDGISKFQFVKLFLYFILHNFIQSLRSNRKIGCSFLLPERRIFI